MNQERLFRLFRCIVWTKETWLGKDEPYTAWRLIYDFGEVHEILD